MNITISPTCPKLSVYWTEVENGGRCTISFYSDDRWQYNARILSRSFKSIQFLVCEGENECEWQNIVTLTATTDKEVKIFAGEHWNYRDKETEHFLFLKVIEVKDTCVFAKN